MKLNPWTLILGMAIVTYLPRMLPMLVLSKRTIPERLAKWMSFIPVSIFSALIFSDVFFWDGNLTLDPLTNFKLIPSLLTAGIAYYTKSLIFSMVVGVASLSLLIYLN